jgi:hypothetical protein
VPLGEANHGEKIKWNKGASVDVQAAVQSNGAPSGCEWANHGPQFSKDQLLPASILGDGHVFLHIVPGHFSAGSKVMGTGTSGPGFRPHSAPQLSKPGPSPSIHHLPRLLLLCPLSLQARPCPNFHFFSLPRARHLPLPVIVTLLEHLHVHFIRFAHSFLVVQEHVLMPSAL